MFEVLKSLLLEEKEKFFLDGMFKSPNLTVFGQVGFITCVSFGVTITKKKFLLYNISPHQIGPSWSNGLSKTTVPLCLAKALTGYHNILEQSLTIILLRLLTRRDHTILFIIYIRHFCQNLFKYTITVKLPCHQCGHSTKATSALKTHMCRKHIKSFASNTC